MLIISLIPVTDLLLTGQGTGEPVKTLIQTITSCSTSRLNEPITVPHLVQAELVSHFSSGHGLGQILLVGEDEEHSLLELILVEHAVKLLLGIISTIAIVGINDEDKTLGVLVVMAPQWADLILATDIPHGEADVLVLDGLDVESNGWDRSNDLTELQLVQNSGLTSGIETDHQDTHFLLAEHALP